MCICVSSYIRPLNFELVISILSYSVSRAGVAGTAGPVLAGPLFRDWPCMRVCVRCGTYLWRIVGVCVRAKLAAAMASCVFRVAWKLPSRRKGVGSSTYVRLYIHVHRTRPFFQGRAHTQHKTVWFTRLEARVGTRYIASRSHAFSR